MNDIPAKDRLIQAGKNTIVRHYRPEDREQVFDVIRNVWHPTVAEKRIRSWDWLIHDNPHSVEGIPGPLVLLVNDHVMGVVLVVPFTMVIKGTEYTNYWVGILTIEKNYRGRGIYLGRGVRDLYPSGSGRTGFPNPHAYNFWNFIDAYNRNCTVGRFPLRSRTLRIFPLISRKFRYLKPAECVFRLFEHASLSVYPFPQQKNYEIIKTQKFDNSIDAFFQKVSPDYPILVKTDSTYLNWRYLNCPISTFDCYTVRKNGEIRGFFVLQDYRLEEFQGDSTIPLLMIMDYLVERNDLETLELILRQAISIARAKKIVQLKLLHNYIDEHQKIFNKLLFLKGKKSAHTLIYYDYPEEIQREFIENPCNWLITRSYADINLI